MRRCQRRLQPEGKLGNIYICTYIYMYIHKYTFISVFLLLMNRYLKPYLPSRVSLPSPQERSAPRRDG